MTDMTLSEFITLSTARDNSDGSWSVGIILSTGQPSTLTIQNCSSEFDAKERSFLYLRSLIYKE